MVTSENQQFLEFCFSACKQGKMLKIMSFLLAVVDQSGASKHHLVDRKDSGAATCLDSVFIFMALGNIQK